MEAAVSPLVLTLRRGASAAPRLLVLLCVSATAWPDWINLTGAETAPNVAEITVAEDAVTVALEVYPPDLEHFERLEGFGLEVRVGGAPLAVEVLSREARERKDRVSPYAGMIDPRTRRRIPGPPEDKRVVFFELRYALADRPEQVTFAPPVDAQGNASATLGFLLYHKAAPVVDFRYLSQPERLKLNWDDPWYTAFENRNLVRHHRWPQMTFLYIEPRELRHESLVRVRDLMAWTEDAPDVHRPLSEADQARLKEVAGDYFLERNPVTIDGKPSRRSAYRAEFLAITPTGLQTVEGGGALDASAALLGVSESYWVEALPQNATMEWQLFDERVDRVPTNMIDPAGPYPGFLDADDPLLTWTNHINEWSEPELRPLPSSSDGWFDLEWLRVALLGAPSEETASMVVRELLRRTAIAYIERDPKQRDAAIAQLVAKPSSEVLGELDRIFAVPTTGGGVAGVTALGDAVLENLAPSSLADGFSVLATWRAAVEGQHWGHVDQRIIRFRAALDVGEVDGFWKLLALTVLEAQTANE